MLGHKFSIRSPYGASVVQLVVASLRYRTTNHVDIVLSRRLGQRRARLAIRNALGISRKVSYLFYEISIYNVINESIVFAYVCKIISGTKKSNNISIENEIYTFLLDY